MLDFFFIFVASTFGFLSKLSNVLLVGCLALQQHACVSQGWVCSDSLRAATLR